MDRKKPLQCLITIPPALEARVVRVHAAMVAESAGGPAVSRNAAILRLLDEALCARGVMR